MNQHVLNKHMLHDTCYDLMLDKNVQISWNSLQTQCRLFLQNS